MSKPSSLKTLQYHQGDQESNLQNSNKNPLKHIPILSEENNNDIFTINSFRNNNLLKDTDVMIDTDTFNFLQQEVQTNKPSINVLDKQLQLKQQNQLQKYKIITEKLKDSSSDSQIQQQYIRNNIRKSTKMRQSKIQQQTKQKKGKISLFKNLLTRKKKPSKKFQQNSSILLKNKKLRIENLNNIVTNYVLTKVVNLQKILTLSEKYRFRNFKERMYPFLYDKTFTKSQALQNIIQNQEEEEEEETFTQKIERINFSCFIPLFQVHSNKRLLWDIIIFLTTLACFIYFPVYFSFNLKLAQDIIQYVSILYFLDIFISINSGYFDRGEHIYHRGKIIIHYLKTKFVADLISNIPIVYLLVKEKYSLFKHVEPYEQYIFFLFFAKYIQLKYIKTKLQDRYQSKKMYTLFLDVIELLFTIQYFSHLFACFWIFIARYGNEQGQQTWIDSYLDRDASQGNYELGIDEYIYAYYFSITTMTTVGYGDINPSNKLEMLLSVIFMLFACVLFAFSINRIGAILEDIKKAKQYKNQIFQSLNNLLNKKHISIKLQFDIREYVDYYVEQMLTEQKNKEQSIIDMLSEPLKRKFLEESNKIILKDSPIFSENFSKELLTDTVQYIEEVKYTPEQVIFKENEESDYIYFIYKGEVQIFLNNPQSSQPNKCIYKMKKGSFGEIEFFTGEKRKFSAISKDFTTLLKIKRKNFLLLLSDFPLDYENYCYIKDLLVHSKSFAKLKHRCYACVQNHSLDQCPYINHNINKHKLLLNLSKHDKNNRISLPYTYLKKQNEDDLKGLFITVSRRKKKYSGLSQLEINQNVNMEFYDDQLPYLEKQSWYQEGGYDTSHSSLQEDSQNNVVTSDDLDKSLDYYPKILKQPSTKNRPENLNNLEQSGSDTQNPYHTQEKQQQQFLLQNKFSINQLVQKRRVSYRAYNSTQTNQFSGNRTRGNTRKDSLYQESPSQKQKSNRRISIFKDHNSNTLNHNKNHLKQFLHRKKKRQASAHLFPPSQNNQISTIINHHQQFLIREQNLLIDLSYNNKQLQFDTKRDYILYFPRFNCDNMVNKVNKHNKIALFQKKNTLQSRKSSSNYRNSTKTTLQRKSK